MHPGFGKKKSSRVTLSSILLCGSCLLLGFSIGYFVHYSTTRPAEPPAILPAPVPLQQTTADEMTKLSPRRLLYMTPVFGMGQLLFLQKALDCMLDICNAGWNVSIYLQVANGMTPEDPRVQEFQRRLYCAHSNSYVPIHIQSYSDVNNLGFGLNKMHRELALSHIDDFDYFVYGEEDIPITLSVLQTFLRAEAELKRTIPSSWIYFTPGFLRYEDKKNNSERVTWEYRQEKVHVVDLGPLVGKYIMTNNPHQAFYIFAQAQLRDLETRCGFLTDSGSNAFYREVRRALNTEWKYMAVGVSEWASSFQQILQCGLKRVIPIDTFFNHMVHHSSNKAQVRRPNKELLNMRDWDTLLEDKLKAPAITLRQMDSITFDQFNLYLVDPSRFERTSRWAWNVTIDPAARIPSYS